MSEDAGARALAYLERRGWKSAHLAPIQGDASTRSYFRATLLDRSEVLLVEPQTGAEASRPFLSIARFLDELGLGPPRVLDHAADLGVIALEDLGEVSLRRALAASGTQAAARAHFAAALDLVARLQTAGTRALTPAVHAAHVRFDAAIFRRELGMFRQRALNDLLGARLAAGEEAAVEAGLDWLAGALAAAPQVLTHRDYHIDNLFVVGGRLRVIDFQDARWGPASYDPASLLTDRDVHRFLDPGDAAELLARFVSIRGLDPEAFAIEYHLSVAQRSLKACGTFADQALGRGRRHYLEYVAPTLARARAAAARFPELQGLARAIAPFAAR